LCDKYDKQNDVSLHALVKNVITLKCNSKNNLPEHITQFDQLWSRFMQRTAGASIDTLESDWATVANSPRAKASILLASLPSSLDNVVDNLSAKTGLTYEDVTNRLTDLSVHKSRNRKDEDDKALEGKDKAKGNGKKSMKQCTQCKK
jgi:hypothetical protein